MSRELPGNHIEQVITEYACDLRRGGYKPEWTKETLLNALRGYSKMIKAEINGTCPINRPEAIGKTSRRVKALVVKSRWFSKTKPANNDQNLKSDQKARKGKAKFKTHEPHEPPETILYVPHTKDSLLKKQRQPEQQQVWQGQSP